MKKRLGAILCALALLCVLTLPAAGAADPVYLLAANDKFCDLPGGVLPVAVGGVIYVPYTVFDRNASGADLGISYAITPERGTVLTLSSGSKSLIFTVKMGICSDGDGNSMRFWAVTRSGIPYVPASAVCSFFGLRYSFLPTADKGTLIRITNPNVRTLSDSVFLSSATLSMTTRYNSILQSRDPQPSQAPGPAASRNPSGAGDGREDVPVYLAVDASAAESDLTVLFPQGVYVLFLFTPDALVEHAAQVRSAAAAGHSVGLILTGSAEEALEQLARGNERLTHIARVRTRMVFAPDADADALAAAGCRLWQPNITGSTASVLLTNLDRARTAGRITLPANPAVISRVLTSVRTDGYALRQPLETDL